MALDSSPGRRTDRRRGRRLFKTVLPLAILQEPFQFAVALISAVLGAGIFITVLVGSAVAFTTLQATLPMSVALIWGAFLFLGGAGVTTAMFLRGISPAWSVVVEMTFLVLLATGWLIYGAAPLLGVGFIAPLVISTLIVFACFARVRAVIVATRVARETAEIKKEVA